MTLPRSIQPLLAFADRYRPRLFSQIEWCFHLLSMPVVMPVGAYYFMGWRYFSDPVTFVSGTLVNLFVYWFSIVIFTLAVRRVIRQFPAVQQAGIRLTVMLLLVGVIMAATAVLAVWLFSVVPGTGVRFSWESVAPMLLFGSIASPIFCLALGMFYIYSQWQDRQRENEQLKREAVQQQYDRLKSQVNPHFLFNSLNAVSSLISEDPVLAERFVDQLAKVYRYMLQANNYTLVPLESELDFTTTYMHLLQVRFGESLLLEQTVEPEKMKQQVPPLTMQTLIDNAIKHNRMTPDKPLVIQVSTRDGQLLVANNLQRKRVRVETTTSSLSILLGKYQMLNKEGPVIDQDDARFTVAVPLL